LTIHGTSAFHFELLSNNKAHTWNSQCFVQWHKRTTPIASWPGDLAGKWPAMAINFITFAWPMCNCLALLLRVHYQPVD